MELKIYKGARPKIIHNKYQQVFSRLIENLEKMLDITIVVEIAPYNITMPEYYIISVAYKFTNERYYSDQERFFIDINCKMLAKQSLYKILMQWLTNTHVSNNSKHKLFKMNNDDAKPNTTIFSLPIAGSLWACACSGTTPIEWLIQLDLGTVEWEWKKIY